MANLRPKCYICDETVVSGVGISGGFTDHTKTSIRDLLRRFVGHDPIRTSESCIGCTDCISRINEYDLACYTAECVQKELTELLNATEEKYFEKVVFLCAADVKDEGTVAMIDFLEEEEPSPAVISQDETATGIDDVKEEGTVTMIDFLEEEEPSSVFAKDGSATGIPKIETLEEDTDEYEIHFFSTDVETREEGDEKDRSEEFIYKTVFSDSQDEIQEMDRTDVELVTVSNRTEPNHRSTNRPKRPPYLCRTCNIEFPTMQALREHRKITHISAGESLICDICGMSYKTRAALQIHTSMHKGISPYECDVCGKKFTQKGALKRHKPIHTGERPYQCEKCGKQFIHYSSIHMHNLAHDDVRDKKCEVCGLMLRSTSHLNRHMLVHTGLKPHTCPKCGKTFAQRYNMTSHLRSHQGIQRRRKYVCQICHQGFTRESLLQEHMSTKLCSAGEGTIIQVYETINDRKPTMASELR